MDSKLGRSVTDDQCLPDESRADREGQAGPVRILILDNAICNGGDAAILLAMQTSLREVFGSNVVVRVCFCAASPEPGVYSELYPDIDFIRTLWRTGADPSKGPSGLRSRLLRRSLPLRFPLQALLSRFHFPYLLLLEDERALLDEYRQADIVIVSGGGFLNSVWTARELYGLRIAQYRAVLNLGVPLVFYAQSIGPFLKADPFARMLRPIFSRAALVLCRDSLSKQTVENLLGGPQAQLIQTLDEALLLEPRSPCRELAPARRRRERIGVCLHQWHWPGATDPAMAQREFENRMAAVCLELVTERNCELVFLTTHQGVEGVHQDDAVSMRVLDSLPEACRGNAHVVAGFVPPREFAYFMGECDAVLSSRLHGAILSLVGGAPVVALAYEPKTTELMRDLCLQDWSLSMWKSSGEEIVATIEHILANSEEARRRCSAAVSRGRVLALSNRELLRTLHSGHAVGARS